MRGTLKDCYLSQRENRRLSRERYRARHPKAVFESNAKYRAEHADVVRSYLAEHAEEINVEKAAYSKLRRKAKLVDKDKALTKEDLLEIMSECKFSGTTEKLVLAHDIPISRGGKTQKGNVFCLCRRCNVRMAAKTIAELIGTNRLVQVQDIYRWSW